MTQGAPLASWERGRRLWGRRGSLGAPLGCCPLEMLLVFKEKTGHAHIRLVSGGVCETPLSPKPDCVGVLKWKAPSNSPETIECVEGSGKSAKNVKLN